MIFYSFSKFIIRLSVCPWFLFIFLFLFCSEPRRGTIKKYRIIIILNIYRFTCKYNVAHAIKKSLNQLFFTKWIVNICITDLRRILNQCLSIYCSSILCWFFCFFFFSLKKRKCFKSTLITTEKGFQNCTPFSNIWHIYEFEVRTFVYFSLIFSFFYFFSMKFMRENFWTKTESKKKNRFSKSHSIFFFSRSSCEISFYLLLAPFHNLLKWK